MAAPVNYFIFKQVLFAGCVIFSVFSCGIFDRNDDDNDTFLIQVDSIHVPESIVLGDTIDISFFGLIGLNGCYYFSHFEEFEADNSIEIEARGGHTPGQFCTDEVIMLDGRTHHYSPETPGTKMIRVLRPEGGPLEQTVEVEQ